RTVSSTGETSGQQVPTRSVSAGQPAPSPPDPRAIASAAATPEAADEEEMVATINEAGQPEVAPVSAVANPGGVTANQPAPSPGTYGAALGAGSSEPDTASVTPGIEDTGLDIPAPEGDEFEDQDPSALTDFEPYLRDQGAWVEHPHYGTVWVPARKVVGAKFVPYVTNGHWSLTPDGDWVWVSDYNFGWVTFHYGRWIWTSDYAWVWIPGRTYAPAWVRF